jgi:putative flavoprotein involved in K+ transport
MGDVLEVPIVIVGGGQSGLSAARAVRDAGLQAVILESGERAVGSWPLYYDSLRLFSPAAFSAVPGHAFPGDPGRYPHRDEVVDYLEQVAKNVDVDIHTRTRVDAIAPDGERSFLVHTASGMTVRTDAVIAASGSFSRPLLPVLPGQDGFSGQLLHSASYRSPEGFAGWRVLVVGAGNSAVQIGYELAQVARVTLATRQPVAFWEQRPGGKDIHHLLRSTGFDDLPFSWIAPALKATPVLDTGVYEEALRSGILDRRPIFTTFDHDSVVWQDGSREAVDAVIFATGYRPSLEYLRPLGALDAEGTPLHAGGISTTTPGLAYVGLEFQRSFSSNTLRGAYRDAQHVVTALSGHLRGAVATVLGP